MLVAGVSCTRDEIRFSFASLDSAVCGLAVMTEAVLLFGATVE
jgi:hypothetical protein